MSANPAGSTGVQSQPAVILLQLWGDEERISCYCKVTRITPGGVRLETAAMNARAFEGIFEQNREVDIFLPLPRPMHPVETKARLVGLQLSYGEDNIPVVFDLEFLGITDKEEEALRDSNPGLLSLRAG